MSSAGPNFPSTGANDATVGSGPWTNPGRITAEDGSSAQFSLGGTSNYLKGTGFGFAIPAGATINGIVLEVKCAGGGNDSSCKLVKGGVIGGTDHALTTPVPSGALAYMSYGGASDLWGRSWTAADINDATFGAVWAGFQSGAVLSVDAFRITVYYTAGSGNFFRFF